MLITKNLYLNYGKSWSQGKFFQERVKERSLQSKDSLNFVSTSGSLEDSRSKAAAAGIQSTVSFSDDEDSTHLSGSKSTNRGRKGASATFRSSRDASSLGGSQTSAKGRGRGRGRGRGSSNLKQTTLDVALGFRHSERSVSVAATSAVRSIADNEEDANSDSSDEVENYEINEVHDSSENEETAQDKGRKRAAPRGRGRGRVSTSSKHGRKSDNTSIHKMLLSKDEDDEDDDDDNVTKRMNKSQPQVTRNYGALRR